VPQIPVHSIDDPRLAPYRALNERNLTRQSGLFIAEGDKVTERLIASRYPVASLLAEAAWAELLEPRLPPETPILVAQRKLLEATIGFNFHRGVLGCGRRLPSPTIDDIARQAAPTATFLVCTDVHDPTNLGSVIRTAAAFGCTGLVLGSQCADPFSRRVLRVSMGAVLQLPMVESRNLAADLQSLHQAGFTLAATVIDNAAEPLDTFQRPAKLALLLGSEGHGLTPQWLALCDRRITIPMQLGIDSLNVAAACAVFLYHCTRE
jgi:rRNA methylases